MKSLLLVNNFNEVFHAAASFFKSIVFVEIDFVVFSGFEEAFGNMVLVGTILALGILIRIGAKPASRVPEKVQSLTLQISV